MSLANLAAKRGLKIQRAAISSAYWLSSICDGASRIIIPLYFTSINYSPVKIGIMFFFYELFGLIANIYCGFFINRYGYKISFILALLMHTIASAGYLLIASDTKDVVLTILIVNALRAFRGVGKEMIKTTSSAYFKKLSPRKTKANPIQLLVGGKDSMKGIGLLAGGVLLTAIGFHYSFSALAVLTMVALLFSLVFINDIREKKQISYTGFINVRRKMHYLALARAFLYSGRDLWLVIALPIFLTNQGYSPVTISAILAVGLIVFGTIQPLFAVFVKTKIRWKRLLLKRKWRYKYLLPSSTIILSLIPLSLLVFPISPELLVSLVVLYNFIAGVATVPHNHLHLKFAKLKRASIDIAYYKTVAQLGKVFSIVASGFLMDRFGLNGCLVASAFSLVTASAISLPIAKKKSSTSKKPSTKPDNLRLTS